MCVRPIEKPSKIEFGSVTYSLLIYRVPVKVLLSHDRDTKHQNLVFQTNLRYVSMARAGTTYGMVY
jgi:hypothetical protein